MRSKQNDLPLVEFYNRIDVNKTCSLLLAVSPLFNFFSMFIDI
jgi:hypothetical protein